MDLELRNRDGELHRFALDSRRDQTFSLILDGGSISGRWLRAGPNAISLLADDGHSHLVYLARDDTGQLHVQYRGRVYHLCDPGAEDDTGTVSSSADSGGDINERGEILSPMPGKIVGLPVAVGEKVAAGDLLVILESMKMENPVLSPVAGTVSCLPLAVGEVAGLGDPLIQLTVEEDG